MKPYKAVAALIAAGAFGAAFANPTQGTWRLESDYTYANAPIASPLDANSEDDLVKQVVSALNDDASLKGSKITVSSDNGVVSLTGVTNDETQANKAVQIASSKAGGDNNVVTVLQSTKMNYKTLEQLDSERRIEQAETTTEG